MPHYTLALTGREALAYALSLIAIGAGLAWVFHC
jgi:hypothetical protein